MKFAVLKSVFFFSFFLFMKKPESFIKFLSCPASLSHFLCGKDHRVGRWKHY